MNASPTWINEVDQMLVELYPADKPGAAVIIVQDGRVLFRKGYGMAHLELGVPVAPEMVFRIGSITKQFTAVSILMLLEQGKLDLQDEITRYLPDYPTGGRKVTVEHLITHTSGIKSYTSMPEWLPLWRKDLTLEELINVFKDQPFDFEPGEKFDYNNSGYVLLGAIIEKISGLSYAEFVQKNIFEPLGMAHTQYDQTAKIIPGRVAGYSAGNDGPVNTAYLSMTHPHAAGALLSSVDDLALWDAALLANTLLKPETLEKAYQPFTLKNGNSTGYGFGWAISSHEGLRLIEHGGGINGYTCGGIRVPSEKVYVAVLTNFDAHKTAPDHVAFKLAAIACGRSAADPTPIELSEEALDVYLGVYQISEGEDRIITREGKQLFMQRTGGLRSEIFACDVDTFFIKDSRDRFYFVREESGKVTAIKAVRRYGMAELAPKMDKPLPQERQAIELSPEQLARMRGTYELAPGYNIEISLDGSQLWIQPPGQEKLKLFAATPEKLFVREVDVTITYQFDEQGHVSECTFQQGPQTMPLKKVK
jgi:CubicO group peptidase (beta-lactamase class C family)